MAVMVAVAAACLLMCLSAVAAVSVVTLEGPDALVRVIVDDDAVGNRTYISELYLKRAGSIATASVVFNFSQVSGGYTPDWSTSRLSSTALAWLDGSGVAQWAGSTGGSITAQSPSALTIAGIALGPASETWTIDVSSGFTWRADRAYGSAAAVAVTCDRGPALILNTEFNLAPAAASQVPSVLDAGMQFDPTTGHGFPCDLGTTRDSRWSLAAAPAPTQRVFLAPSLLAFDVALACAGSGAPDGCGLAFAWPGVWAGSNVGVVLTSLASGGSAPSGAPRSVPAAATVNFSWVWAPAPTNARPEGSEPCPQGLVPFNFTHPDADAQAAACWLAAGFNMWSGNVQGNSPGSVVCLHEMSWFPLNQGIFAGTAGHAALQRQLAMFAQFGVRADGYVYARWQPDSFSTMAIHDQIGHFLTAYYWHAVNTGDAAFISSVWPTLLRVVGYVNSTMRFAQDGLATTPAPATGLPNSNVAGNWFDIVDFGGRDAITNALICQGLNATALLAGWIGDQANAATLAAMHLRCAAAYNTLFWNESLGLYGDWADIDGNVRYYGYIWQQALAADPLAGIANASRAARMAGVVLARLEELRQEYNKSAAELWCAPTNLWSVSPADLFGNGSMQDQKDFGNYENGACFVALHGELEALLHFAGMPDAVWGALNATLAATATSRLWGQHLDWRWGGGFQGFDVLTDTMFVLRAALHGTFGLTQSLGRLEATPGGAAAGMEGASWVFMHMGAPVRATVRNGTSVLEFLQEN
jgi:hypothetical protein